jgi:hypothetical protein
MVTGEWPLGKQSRKRSIFSGARRAVAVITWLSGHRNDPARSAQDAALAALSVSI